MGCHLYKYQADDDHHGGEPEREGAICKMECQSLLLIIAHLLQTGPVSAQLLGLPVSLARVHSCAVVQYLSLHCIGQRAEPCFTVGTCATVLLSVHQFLLRAGPCCTLFSGVVVPLYHLVSWSDRIVAGQLGNLVALRRMQASDGSYSN